MIVKIMSGEDLPDSDPRKRYDLYDGVNEVNFSQDDKGDSWAHMYLYMGSEDTLDVLVTGNVYVMNDNGKTVSTFAPGPQKKGNSGCFGEVSK